MNEKFFINSKFNAVDYNEIQKKSRKNLVTTGKTLPTGDNILVFSGIVSQNYGNGESSRNNYKYDQTGWDFSHYNNNPIIAWQHDYDYGAIGHALDFWLDENGNLNSTFYVDLNTLEPRHAVQVKNGYVTGISTGATTDEYMFEEKDGTRLTEEEAVDKYGEWNVFASLLGWNTEYITLVITKAKLLENSLVTIGSNEKAIAHKNSVNAINPIADAYAKKHNLTYNKNYMEFSKEAFEAMQKSHEDAIAKLNQDHTSTLDNLKADHLKEIEELKANHASEIETLKNNFEKEVEAKVEEKVNEKVTAETNKIREEERKNLKNLANVSKNAENTETMTATEFAQKYSNK